MIASVYDVRGVDKRRPRTSRTPAKRTFARDMPEALQEDGADIDTDVTAAKRPDSQAKGMNQSLFGMITQAGGSNRNFQARFDDNSSNSEEDDDDGKRQEHMAKTLGSLPHQASSRPGRGAATREKSASAASQRSLLQRLKLKPVAERRKDNEDEEQDIMSSSQILAPPTAKTASAMAPSASDEPFLAQQLEAETDADMSSKTKEEAYLETSGPVTGPHTRAVSLSQKLMDMFGFQEPEEVIGEWKCSLLQNTLLPGYLYITTKHLCFYAYLPKRASAVSKSGYLSKRGRRNPNYKRYHFELKGDVLTYYNSPTAKYFPRGNIDLRVGISATTATATQKSKDATYFTVTTNNLPVHFKADTIEDAQSWTKHIQKAIFRAHNEGEAVKISLPIENILEIEEAPILEGAEAVKIRIIDNDETYTVDEYFFSFFGNADRAVKLLHSMIENNDLREVDDREDLEASEGSSRTRTPSPRQRESNLAGSMVLDRRGMRSPPLRENVHEVIAPLRSTPKRISQLDTASKTERNQDVSEQSSRSPSPESPRRRRRSLKGKEPQHSRGDSLAESSTAESPITASRETDADSSPVVESMDETINSASQVLNSSTVFHRPSTQLSRENRKAETKSARPKVEIKTRHTKERQTQPTIQENEQSQDITPATQQAQIARPARPSRLAYSSGQVPTLQDLVKAGSYPIQRATGLAGYLRKQSKQVGSMLATESMGYYEKMSDMWAGGGRHYGSIGALTPDDDVRDSEDESKATRDTQRFRGHFALAESEQLIASHYTYMHRVLPLYGKIYIGSKHLCYRSLLPGTRTKIKIPLRDIEAATKEKGYRLGYCALVVAIRGHEEVFFDFGSVGHRDDCAITLLLSVEQARTTLKASGLLTQDEVSATEAAKAEYDALKGSDSVDQDDVAASVIFETNQLSQAPVAPPGLLKITCLTIGSRGDVQPYIALCKRLLEQGHKPRIASHAEFEGWVRSYGIDFVPVGGDPAELMRICVENGMFTFSFMREATGKFRGWLDELLVSAWGACQGSDLLIESPSTMAGIHIAEALNIPYFRAFTMPWTRTRAYPHAFAVPDYKMGGAYNYWTYNIIETIFWTAIAGQINRWRKETLNLGPTNLELMQSNKVPFLYNFSPNVVPPPLDFGDWVHITGYWFLEEGKSFVPPPDLAAFIAKARADGKKLVYVGFGSIVVDDPYALTRTVIDSVLKADVRCVLSKGWSDRFAGTKKDKATLELEAAAAASAELHSTPLPSAEPKLPDSIFQIQSAPHDWLFSQMDAAVHHGGAGTTGASLRAGIPTVIKPFFGDQFFFGQRVENLGVGICLKVINTIRLARAFWEATHDERMRLRAKALGEQIRSEDGAGVAVQTLWRNLEYAKSLVAAKQSGRKADPSMEPDSHAIEGDAPGTDALLPDAETWTFVGDESDPELVMRKEAHRWDPDQKRGGVLQR